LLLFRKKVVSCGCIVHFLALEHLQEEVSWVHTLVYYLADYFTVDPLYRFLVLHVLHFNLTFELQQVTLLLDLLLPSFLYLQLRFAVVTAQFSVLKALFQGVLRAVIVALLIIVFISLLLFLFVNAFVVDSVVQVCVVVLLVLPVYVLAFRGKPDRFFIYYLPFYLCWPLVGSVVFIVVARSGVKRSQNYRLGRRVFE